MNQLNPNISTFPCVTPISDVDTIVSTVFLPILAFKVACKNTICT